MNVFWRFMECADRYMQVAITCRFCGCKLTANEIKAYGDMCTICWPEYAD